MEPMTWIALGSAVLGAAKGGSGGAPSRADSSAWGGNTTLFGEFNPSFGGGSMSNLPSLPSLPSLPGLPVLDGATLSSGAQGSWLPWILIGGVAWLILRK